MNTIEEKLYYSNQYTKDFVAEITELKEIDNKFHIKLDKTAFFPGGGGQFCDLGEIDNKKVIDVYENDNGIYHVTIQKPSRIHKVKCNIDWDRREDGMHQHFAQHILSGCFYSKYNANTVGFHLGSESSTVDINANLDEDMIRSIEMMANEIIRENIEAEFLTPTKKELKKLRLRRDLPKTNQEIRVVKIGDLDINACCGVHPKSSLDLRMIKIKRWEKNRGATRIEYLAGKRAIDEVIRRDNVLNKMCLTLKCGEEEGIKALLNLNEKIEEISRRNRKLEDIVSDYQIKNIIDDGKKIGDLTVVKKIYEEEDLKYINKVAKKISEYENVISMFASKSESRVNLIFASNENIKDISMAELLKDAIKLVDGKGGGSKNLAQGGGKNNGNLDLTLEYAANKIEKIVIGKK